MTDIKYAVEQDESFILAISLWPALCLGEYLATYLPTPSITILKKLQAAKGIKNALII